MSWLQTGSYSTHGLYWLIALGVEVSCLVTLSGVELMLKGAVPGDAPLVHPR